MSGADTPLGRRNAVQAVSTGGARIGVPLTLIIHADRSLVLTGRQAVERVLILGRRCDRSPAGGPGGRGFHGAPLFPFLVAGMFCVLVRVPGPGR
jgi:hypothetical protein